MRSIGEVDPGWGTTHARVKEYCFKRNRKSDRPKKHVWERRLEKGGEGDLTKRRRRLYYKEASQPGKGGVQIHL